MEIDRAEVVVIGAGVTGLSSAWWLAQEGVDVLVVEEDVIGYEASSRNGGLGSVRLQDAAAVAWSALSMELWPTMDDRLGYPTEAVFGSITVALDEEDLDEIRLGLKRFQRFGFHGEELDPQALRELVPIVSPDAPGGTFQEHAVNANPQRTVQAYGWGILDHGGRIRQHTRVTDINVEGDSVVSVETDDGTIGCNFVVCAAGPQTGVLAEKAGVFVPVSPGRVEIIVTAPMPLMKYGAINGNGLYGRQTRRGNLAYGGGNQEWVDMENKTPEKPNTPLIRNVGRRLNEMFAGAGDLPMIRSWACVVEQTPDSLPIFDLLDRPDNMVVATVSANGFSESPATGKVISELVMHGETSTPIDGLGLGRFADVSQDWREQRGWTAAPERDS